MCASNRLCQLDVVSLDNWSLMLNRIIKDVKNSYLRQMSDTGTNRSKT